jgi:hypothetical protein
MNTTYSINQWIHVPIGEGNPNGAVFLGLSANPAEPPHEWMPAFVEGNDLLVRAPARPGPHYLWRKTNTDTTMMALINIAY